VSNAYSNKSSSQNRPRQQLLSFVRTRRNVLQRTQKNEKTRKPPSAWTLIRRSEICSRFFGVAKSLSMYANGKHMRLESVRKLCTAARFAHSIRPGNMEANSARARLKETTEEVGKHNTNPVSAMRFAFRRLMKYNEALRVTIIFSPLLLRPPSTLGL
jgi:hypothetical protein